MKRGTLIQWSIARDALDFLVIGQVPPFSWMFDLPILAMHFMYAGSAALVTLAELIPVVGVLPIFTIAAICYPDPNQPPRYCGGGGSLTVTPPTEVVEGELVE